MANSSPSLPFQIDPPVRDWPRLLAPHPALLVLAPARATDIVLELLAPHLRQPIHWRDCRHTADSAWPTGRGSTVLRNVDALDDQQQGALLRWLEDAQTETQVVSVTEAPLFSRVQTGTFLDRLYYHLNVVTLMVDALPPAPAGDSGPE